MTTTTNESDTEDSSTSNERWLPSISEVFMELAAELLEEMHYIEQLFIKMQGIYAFVCQMCFFTLFDLLTDSDDDFDDKSVILALTSILFYSVLAYFVSRLREIWQTHRLRTMPTFPNTRYLLQWICKVALEWAKALVIVLCLKEQGINYDPTFTYSLVTFTYYLSSEKIFLQVLPELMEMLDINCLEHLEHLYVPIVLNLITIAAGVFTTTYILLVKYSHFVLLSVYFLVYLRLKDVYHNNWKSLKAERLTFKSFRTATREDIDSWSDICAVCLCTMSSAKITPCNHLFHAHCLKQCLKTSFFCPLCKRHFMEHVEIK